MAKSAVVIGGGLAGLTTACELLERGCNVTILDKEKNLGGNSSKATCGIAAPMCGIQKASGIEDDAGDLIKLGGPEAVPLVKSGTSDVEWLIKALDLTEELVLRVTPGHQKKARTIGTREQFPGMVVTYAALQTLKRIAQVRPERLQIVSSAEVQELIVEGSKVVGAKYLQGGNTEEAKGIVVLATGGFAGDLSANGVLASNCDKSYASLPTTNDERARGDGIKLGQAVGAGIESLSKIQVCPTALVWPGQEDSDLKFVASDAFCGAGAVLLNADGLRFCDEMASADERVEAMRGSKPPFRLVLPKSKAEEVGWLCNFYLSKEVMKLYANASKLAADMQVDAGNFPKMLTGELYVGVVTPALHSCAGGVCVGWSGEKAGKVLQAGGSPIEGLFAAGEVASAPYAPIWSSTGIPLLHCVYSGRLVGRAVATQILGTSEPTIQALASLQTAPTEEEKKAAETKERPLEDMSKEELIQKIKDLEANGVVKAAAPAGPPMIPASEVAKHTSKDDAWLILFGEAIDVTKWIPIHPGGEAAIMSMVGKDATEEWTMIHKRHHLDANKAHLTMLGKVGDGPAPVANGAAPAAPSGPTLDDVAKHNKQDDAWLVVNGDVLNVTTFIPVHPGGVQAICQYLGKDASEEWNIIHKAGTVEKMMATPTGPKLVGKLAGSRDLGPPPPPVDMESPPPEGDGGIPGLPGAIIFLALNVIRQVLKTVFFTGNFIFKIDGNRTGTIRSAIFLLTFTIIHALGNFTDMLGGPNETNGEGYFFDRLYWTGFGLPASVVEEYLALALLLHVTVALKRSWDISINYCLYTGKWNMLLSGLTVLFFLMKHLSDFRFASDIKFTMLRPPPYYIAFDGLLEGRVFYMTDDMIPEIKVRDLYTKEFELFKQPVNVGIYTFAVVVFVLHMCWGWQKVIPADAMQIPKSHLNKVKWMGWILASSIGAAYLSVVWVTFFGEKQHVDHVPK